jgi:hypothetical protein
MKNTQIDYTRPRRVILFFYSVGFLIGTYTHLYNIITRGFLSISHLVPWYVNLYWDSLTLFDPLAAILIWFKLRDGLLLAIAIMATDLMINTYSYYLSGWFGNVIPGMVPATLLLQSFLAPLFLSPPVCCNQRILTLTRFAKNDNNLKLFMENQSVTIQYRISHNRNFYLKQASILLSLF